MSSSDSTITFSPHLKTNMVWRGMGANDTYFEGFSRATSIDLIHPYWNRVKATMVGFEGVPGT